ncbi:MAG TPA: SH3 domain-containing C40 family peptidase [Bacteroidales bacterium]|jgi:cell wall-associated NlpC family hydrolase|nr:SH3 domain-containing C40 family peptidase [Bacteroidales bacterium]HOS71017.1 SH3 domain-containing C40 family peptidase [Bacteroidales bacterium]HQH25224.1 SH3 domain-containing C40 family peptidase [Bacteroidales bacterium]HQJ82779.1 SH3 domain-containing C40 family peptidase [Bacteroidales bacterium]
MKHLFRILLILLFISGCKPSEVPLSLQNEIDSIVLQYIPDKREALCNLDMEILKDRRLLIKGETSIPELKAEILKHLEQSGTGYADSIKVLPDKSETARSWGLICVSVANLKKDPSHSSELVSQTVMGTPVRILKKEGSWLLMQTPDHYLGWTTASSVSGMDESGFQEWKESDRLIYTSRTGDILSEGSGKEVVSDVVTGSILKRISAGRDYFTVELPDGRKGRINRKDAEDFEKWRQTVRPEADKLVSFAESLTGVSYLWGGTSTKMLDCSGLVKTAYFTGGIILARDASQQFRYGEEVDISSSFEALRPGDLLFFGSVNDKGEKRITHTGMYIGNNEFIHASTGRGMVANNILDPDAGDYDRYLVSILQGARRIIGVPSGKGLEHISQNNWYR